MLTAPLVQDFMTPSIEMALNPGTTVAVETTTSGASAPAGGGSGAGMFLQSNDNSVLPDFLYLNVDNLDLSDTGGMATGQPDSCPIVTDHVPGTDYYIATDLTIHTIGADIYVSWDSYSSSWVMNVNTMGGLSWTGIGSSTYENPLGSYTTASYSEAGSGSVMVT